MDLQSDESDPESGHGRRGDAISYLALLLVLVVLIMGIIYWGTDGYSY